MGRKGHGVRSLSIIPWAGHLYNQQGIFHKAINGYLVNTGGGRLLPPFSPGMGLRYLITAPHS